MFTQLYGGCYRSEMHVTPKNWAKKNACIQKNGKNYKWRIHYRFYDPAYKNDPQLWGKQIKVQGMNEHMDLAKRQDVTKGLFDNEKKKVDKLGYNPITGQYMAPNPSPDQPTHQDIIQPHEPADKSPLLQIVNEQDVEINANTDAIVALEYALKKVKVEEPTRADIKGSLKYFAMSALRLNKNDTTIGQMKPKLIELILDNCEHLMVVKPGHKPRKKIWNTNQFNHYRKNLRTLFTYLEKKSEVIEYNPIDKIDVRFPDEEEEEIPRDVLTDEQRNIIDDHLLAHYPTFHRFVNIFYSSGARIREILKVKRCHVDLENQRFKVKVRKGRKKAGQMRFKWEWKTITNPALPFWKALLNDGRDNEGNPRECLQEEYLFSEDLRPGANFIRTEQLTRRWKTHAKDKLGITADLYSLKHLFSTEVIDCIGNLTDLTHATKIAAEHNNHTSDEMVKRVYDVRRMERRHNLIKYLPITFKKPVPTAKEKMVAEQLKAAS